MDRQRMLEDAVMDALGKHGATFIEGFEALLAVIVYGDLLGQHQGGDAEGDHHDVGRHGAAHQGAAQRGSGW